MHCRNEQNSASRFSKCDKTSTNQGAERSTSWFSKRSHRLSKRFVGRDKDKETPTEGGKEQEYKERGEKGSGRSPSSSWLSEHSAGLSKLLSGRTTQGQTEEAKMEGSNSTRNDSSTEQGAERSTSWISEPSQRLSEGRDKKKDPPTEGGKEEKEMKGVKKGSGRSSSSSWLLEHSAGLSKLLLRRTSEYDTEEGRSSTRAERRTSLHTMASSVTSAASGVRKYIPEKLPWHHDHPELHEASTHWESGTPSGKVAAVAAYASHKTGKLWGVRHAAAALHWYHTLPPEEQQKLYEEQRELTKKLREKGEWKLNKAGEEGSKEIIEEASFFHGGYGELFLDKHAGGWQLLPNYIYFAIEALFIIWRIIFLVFCEVDST